MNASPGAQNFSPDGTAPRARFGIVRPPGNGLPRASTTRSRPLDRRAGKRICSRSMRSLSRARSKSGSLASSIVFQPICGVRGARTFETDLKTGRVRRPLPSSLASNMSCMPRQIPKARKPRLDCIANRAAATFERVRGGPERTDAGENEQIGVRGRSRIGLETQFAASATQCLGKRVKVPGPVVEERDAHQLAARIATTRAASARSIIGQGAAVIRNASPMPRRSLNGRMPIPASAATSPARTHWAWGRAGNSQPTEAARVPSREVRGRDDRGSRRHHARARRPSRRRQSALQRPRAQPSC